ncbi:MAG: DNA-binding response regulator [Bacteroidetes bacterium]|jgi:DNA-binding response OmpR family regulator|nr:DNA-binding response regulator [Bacteroidota bacterium]
METSEKKQRILIVDDEEDIREILHFNLENEGYEIDQAESAEEALNVLNESHNLILLDVMMGGMSGFKLAQLLRKSGNNVPIVFLTAKNTENDLLSGFSIGGDDYISKPFSVKEVIARIKTILKRAGSSKDEKNVGQNIVVDGLIIDLEKKIVQVNEEAVELTHKEFNILVLLVQNPGKIYTRTDILDKAWSDNSIVLDRTVDVHITRLRKKIGEYGKYIISRTGYGYSFSQK